MKRSSRKLSLSRETVLQLNEPVMRQIGGGIVGPRGPLQPSSGTDWSDQSVCPSYCYSDCFSKCYSCDTCPV